MALLMIGMLGCAAMRTNGASVGRSRRCALQSVVPISATVFLGPKSSLAAEASAPEEYKALLRQFEDPAPRQQSGNFMDAMSAGFSRVDNLCFPPWMEGTWIVRSVPLANAAPLGRRYLPADLARMRLGDLRELRAEPLTYGVRFYRRGDGKIVSDRAGNLRSVQNAAAGYNRVETVAFDGVGKISVVYSPFGRNGTYPGPSRAEIYINWRRQSPPLQQAPGFAFAEATRSVFLAQQRELSTISDAETLCEFTRTSDNTISGRQRVLRYLTPNPNSIEGALWSEANGRAVATLDYALELTRAPALPQLQ